MIAECGTLIRTRYQAVVWNICITLCALWSMAPALVRFCRVFGRRQPNAVERGSAHCAPSANAHRATKATPRLGTWTRRYPTMAVQVGADQTRRVGPCLWYPRNHTFLQEPSGSTFAAVHQAVPLQPADVSFLRLLPHGCMPLRAAQSATPAGIPATVPCCSAATSCPPAPPVDRRCCMASQPPPLALRGQIPFQTSLLADREPPAHLYGHSLVD